MNTNTQKTNTTIVAPVAHTTTEGNNMNTQPTQKRFKMNVLELYISAVEQTITSKKSATQLSASGHEFTGLNKAILNDAKAQLGFKSNVWLNEKQMKEANMVQKSEDDFGVILFSTILKDVEGSKKKEKVLKYYRVFNQDALEQLPL